MESGFNNHYGRINREGTGSHENLETSKILDYPFNNYMVKVRLTPSNEFIGIEEIEINKDFMAYTQKRMTKGYLDVEKYYKE